MATYKIESTDGTPVTVIYPAERPSGHRAVVRFRVGKKTTLPAYTAASLPHLVQFLVGQQIVMFLLADVLETSYWRKIRNAYTLLGQLDIDEGVRVDSGQTKRITQWLRDQSAGAELARGRFESSQPVQDWVSE